MINSKKKGNHGEQLFAQFLRENNIKAWKDSASGGGSGDKGDINNSLNLSIEVKTVKKINLRKAWEQVNHAASLGRNSPLLAIHLDGMREKQWIVCIDNSDWVELIKNQTQDKESGGRLKENSKVGANLRYEIENAKRAISRLLKIVDELQEIIN